MTAVILYLTFGGALVGFAWEKGDDDLTSVVMAALWPALIGMFVVYWWRTR